MGGATVVAVADPAAGVVEAIFTAPAAGVPCLARHTVRTIPGGGLEGDRYAAGEGTFSGTPGAGRQLTLIAAEVLEALAVEEGIALTGADARRNLVTRGVDLDALLGSRFRIGTVECVAVRDCPPCKTLQERTQPGVLEALAGRGGIRADILTQGSISVGDAIVVLERVGHGA